MAFGMLFSPEHSQELWPVVLHVERASNLSVTGQAQGKHFRWIAVARLPVMYCHRPLSTLYRYTSSNAASVVVPLQHFLTMPAEILLILALQRVASRTQALSENLRVPAGAMHHDLSGLLHLRGLELLSV